VLAVARVNRLLPVEEDHEVVAARDAYAAPPVRV